MENPNAKQIETLGRQVFRIKRLQEKMSVPGARVVLAVTNAKGCNVLVYESQLREVLGIAFDPVVSAAIEQIAIQLAAARSDAETEIELLQEQ